MNSSIKRFIIPFRDRGGQPEQAGVEGLEPFCEVLPAGVRKFCRNFDFLDGHPLGALSHISISPTFL